MIFCVVADGSVKDADTMPDCDVAVFGLKGLGEVDYEHELKGLTDKFEEAARFPKRRSAACFAVAERAAAGYSESRCRSPTRASFWAFRT